MGSDKGTKALRSVVVHLDPSTPGTPVVTREVHSVVVEDGHLVLRRDDKCAGGFAAGRWSHFTIDSAPES